MIFFTSRHQLRKTRLNLSGCAAALIIVSMHPLFHPCFGQATPYIIDAQRYTTEEGLSNSAVYRIWEDSKGFTWIGTNDGLNR